MAIPEILRLISTILKRISEMNKRHRKRQILKGEINEINEAFKNGDAAKLDKLWNSERNK